MERIIIDDKGTKWRTDWRSYAPGDLDALKQANYELSEAAALGLIGARLSSGLKNYGIVHLPDLLDPHKWWLNQPPTPEELLRSPNLGVVSLMDLGMLLTALRFEVSHFDYRNDHLFDGIADFSKKPELKALWQRRFDVTATMPAQRAPSGEKAVTNRVRAYLQDELKATALCWEVDGHKDTAVTSIQCWSIPAANGPRFVLVEIFGDKGFEVYPQILDNSLKGTTAAIRQLDAFEAAHWKGEGKA